MSPWAVFAGVLLVAGLVPAVVVGARGRAVIRLAGLQFGGAVAVLVLLALCAAPDTTSYLVVPLALVLLSYAGTLVFTRLLAER
jgi:multisubunit Na+/H+ antiporter MnhF subunit